MGTQQMLALQGRQVRRSQKKRVQYDDCRTIQQISYVEILLKGSKTQIIISLWKMDCSLGLLLFCHGCHRPALERSDAVRREAKLLEHILKPLSIQQVLGIRIDEHMLIELDHCFVPGQHSHA
mmetsp:Transcript_16053/g.46089  ORF Transcript_16053/g.46089 Transcript_16053/m.46089 type:complete len:123 (-) Transcript_16053:931-1299(-)